MINVKVGLKTKDGKWKYTIYNSLIEVFKNYLLKWLNDDTYECITIKKI